MKSIIKDISPYFPETNAIISILVFVLQIFFTCNQTNLLNRKNYRSITLVYTLEFVKTDDNRLITLKDSIDIFYFGLYTIYGMPYRYESTRVNRDKQGRDSNETLVEKKIKYKYMIYNKGKDYGYMFDSLTAKNPGKIMVDSFLLRTAFKSFPFYTELKQTLLKSAYNDDSHTLTEKYIPKIKVDSSYPDTIYYFFNKDFNNVDFSFSKELDSVKKMKLFKVEFVTNAIVKKDKTIPKRTFLFEIKHNRYDTTSMVNFVNWFKKQEATGLGSKKQ